MRTATDEHTALIAAVRQTLEDGRRPPCRVDPDPFTADDATARQEAAEACLTACPVLEVCAAYAEAAGETHHVWAGRDRTPAPSGRRRQP